MFLPVCEGGHALAAVDHAQLALHRLRGLEDARLGQPREGALGALGDELLPGLLHLLDLVLDGLLAVLVLDRLQLLLLSVFLLWEGGRRKSSVKILAPKQYVSPLPCRWAGF